MEQCWIDGPEWPQQTTAATDAPAQIAGDDITDPDVRMATYLAAAADSDAGACFELGVAFSTGSMGVTCDLIEAHKWFNLSAVGGHDEAKTCRAEIADEMTAREIAEAQRRARQWLTASARRAA